MGSAGWPITRPLGDRNFGRSGADQSYSTRIGAFRRLAAPHGTDETLGLTSRFGSVVAQLFESLAGAGNIRQFHLGVFAGEHNPGSSCVEGGQRRCLYV
jgi:hypothetical protein